MLPLLKECFFYCSDLHYTYLMYTILLLLKSTLYILNVHYSFIAKVYTIHT